MQILKALILLSLIHFLIPAARADNESIQLWGGAGYNSSATSGRHFSGQKILAGVLFPSPPDESQTLRISASRTFDSSDTHRYSFLAHIGYRVLGPLEIAFLGGMGFLEDRHSGGTYLKPVLGLELIGPFFHTGSSSISAFASYEVFRGSTGSIALDGGSDALTTRSIAVGLTLSFELLRDPPTRRNSLTQ